MRCPETNLVDYNLDDVDNSQYRSMNSECNVVRRNGLTGIMLVLLDVVDNVINGVENVALNIVHDVIKGQANHAGKKKFEANIHKRRRTIK